MWTSILLAAYSGRDDVLRLLTERGIPVTLSGVDALIAACASDDSAAIAAAIARDPRLADGIVALEARCSPASPATAMRRASAIFSTSASMSPRRSPRATVTSVFLRKSLAIHIAAWRGYPAVVKLLY